MIVRTIEARTHGRYLVRQPTRPGPWPMIVGFHGYRENAAIHLGVLARIPGADHFLLVAVQGLHRFYMKGSDVVASWMTKEDRDLAIADNIAYVGGVLEAVRSEFVVEGAPVFVGFSQGVAMAFRAAAHHPARGLIVVGADVPPDVLAVPRVAMPPVLYGRGKNDELYTAEWHDRDIAALEQRGVPVERLEFDGGHELTEPFLVAAGRFLSR